MQGWICLIVWGTTLSAGIGIVLLPWLAHCGKHGKMRVQQVKTLLQLLRQPRLLVHTTALSVIIQVANIILVWLVGMALSLEANIPFSYYWILVPMVSVLTLLPISVNGMGVREWGTFLLLGPLGVSETAAVRCRFCGSWCASAPACWAAWLICPAASPAFPTLPRTANENGSVDHHSDQGRDATT